MTPYQIGRYRRQRKRRARRALLIRKLRRAGIKATADGDSITTPTPYQTAAARRIMQKRRQRRNR